MNSWSARTSPESSKGRVDASQQALMLLRVGHVHARRCDVRAEAAEDCAAAFAGHLLELCSVKSASISKYVDSTTADGQATATLNFQVPCTSPAWLARCAINFARNWKRTERRRDYHEQSWSDLTPYEQERDIDESLIQSKVHYTSPLEERLVRQELHDQLHRCLAQMPDCDHNLLIRHYVDGEQLKHLADELGKTEASLKQHLYRLRRKLRKMLIYSH